MAAIKKNYRSDLVIDMHLTLGGVPVIVPEHDFILRFYSVSRMRHYDVGRSGGVLYNCATSDGDSTLLRCYVKNHGLQPGELQCEYIDLAPEAGFEDGIQRTYTVTMLDGVELVEDNGDDSTGISASVAIDINGAISDARSAASRADAAADSASDAADRANDAADAATEAIADLDAKLAAKQDTLVSGQNIKTINNLSLLGSGNITIQGGGGEQVQSDWTETDSSDPSYIQNKPTLATVATSGSYNDLSNKPTIPDAQIQSDWSQSDNTKKDYIKNKPTIPAAQVQSNWNESDTNSKAYIQNKPTIPAAQVNADWDAASGVAAILNKPSIPDLSTYCPIIEDGRSSSVAAITGTAPFSSLVDGQRIVLHFKFRNEASPTLQLTLSGGTTTSAYPLYQNYNSGVGALTVQAMPAGSYGEFVYDATNSRWVLLGKDVNTTYANTSQADINNSAQGSRLIEPALLRTNFYLKSEATPKRVYVDNSADASVQLSVTTYNDLGTLSTWKTITLPASYDRADEFVFRFTCNDASLTPTLPAGVVMADKFEWSEMAVGVVFQVSICDGIAAYLVLTPNT